MGDQSRYYSSGQVGWSPLLLVSILKLRASRKKHFYDDNHQQQSASLDVAAKLNANTEVDAEGNHTVTFCDITPT